MDLDVYAAPTPEEDAPGMATGIATFGDAKYRFHMYWEKVGGDLVLTKWLMTKSG